VSTQTTSTALTTIQIEQPRSPLASSSVYILSDIHKSLWSVQYQHLSLVVDAVDTSSAGIIEHSRTPAAAVIDAVVAVGGTPFPLCRLSVRYSDHRQASFTPFPRLLRLLLLFFITVGDFVADERRRACLYPHSPLSPLAPEERGGSVLVALACLCRYFAEYVADLSFQRLHYFFREEFIFALCPRWTVIVPAYRDGVSVFFLLSPPLSGASSFVMGEPFTLSDSFFRRPLYIFF
jgi:hypothetical protein